MIQKVLEQEKIIKFYESNQLLLCSCRSSLFMCLWKYFYLSSPSPGSMSFLVSELDWVHDIHDCLSDWFCLNVHWSLTFSQRWVSEKLSVESLRDLELFGGEFNSPAAPHVAVLLVPLSANPTAWAYSTVARVSVKGSPRTSNLWHERLVPICNIQRVNWPTDTLFWTQIPLIVSYAGT